MRLSEIRRDWERNGEYCSTEGCVTRKRVGSDNCVNHHGDRRLVDTVDGPRWQGTPLEWTDVGGTLVLL